MTQETNDVVGLIERLELSASESEMGRNLAGTPQTCREAKARLQSQSARIAELEGERDHWKAECKALCDVVSQHTRARAASLTKDSTSG